MFRIINVIVRNENKAFLPECSFLPNVFGNLLRIKNGSNIHLRLPKPIFNMSICFTQILKAIYPGDIYLKPTCLLVKRRRKVWLL